MSGAALPARIRAQPAHELLQFLAQNQAALEAIRVSLWSARSVTAFYVPQMPPPPPGSRAPFFAGITNLPFSVCLSTLLPLSERKNLIKTSMFAQYTH